jgi:hypothetical protein
MASSAGGKSNQAQLDEVRRQFRTLLAVRRVRRSKPQDARWFMELKAREDQLLDAS